MDRDLEDAQLDAAAARDCLRIAKQLAEDDVLGDPDDAELMLAVREQVAAEYGYYPTMSSDLQAAVARTYDKYTNN
jgi:hypothetical protein